MRKENDFRRERERKDKDEKSRLSRGVDCDCLSCKQANSGWGRWMKTLVQSESTSCSFILLAHRHISPPERTWTKQKALTLERKDAHTLKTVWLLYCSAWPDKQREPQLILKKKKKSGQENTQVEVTGNRDTPVMAAKDSILNHSGVIGHYLSHRPYHINNTHTHTQSHTRRDACWHIKSCRATTNWNMTDGVKFGRAA